MRDLELPGRSPVHGPSGMASTSHPLATQTAVAVLRDGGNALDAAVAACAVQCVVEPESTGIGGDCFCLFAPGGSSELVAYNGSGRAPAAATADWYRNAGITALERQSPHSVTVPGSIDAWDRLIRDHGRKPLAELLRPAIGYARDGYPVSSRVSVDFASQLEVLRADPNAARVLLIDGRPPRVGEMQRQPELAETLERIAAEGRDGFYRGLVADDIVGYLREKGGLHTLEDFAGMAGGYVTPISTSYRGFDVFQCPPPGQGVVALILLNVIAGFEDGGPGAPVTAERLHREIEAGRLAYLDRNAYVADPDFAEVPLDWLLSEGHAAELRAAIDPARRLEPLPAFTAPGHESTVYISVVDEDRNACSFINTLFFNFGSGLMAPRSGVMLQNRAQGFVLDPGHPNCIAPGKRPLNTIIPGMVTRDGRAVMPYGVMGGHYQAYGHMQLLSRVLEYGLDLQEAQDLPRVFPDPDSGLVQAEGTLPAELADGLAARGHRLVKPEKPIGGSQAIWIDWDQGVLTGGSDPRKDGCAIGY